MSKILLLSFDDGTVYDERFVELLNRYQIPATLNLNTELKEFVWYFEGRPIRRLDTASSAAKGLYEGHEIASHTLTHPWLTSLSPEALLWEVGEDCRRLRQQFGLEQIGFAVPFTACTEREIQILRDSGCIRYIRLSEMTDRYDLPVDPYHIYIHGLYHDEGIREKLQRFAEDPRKEGLFVLCGHSYELEMYDHWQYMEELLQYIRSLDGVECLTTMEFVDRYYS